MQATAYAAFNLRDSYYPDMVRFIIKRSKSASIELGNVAEIEAGIRMSAIEILKEIL